MRKLSHSAELRILEDRIEDLRRTVRIAIEIVESEADRRLQGERPAWKQAACAAVEELYAGLGHDDYAAGNPRS